MKPAKEKSKCDKCGNYHYCDAHHILPKKIFGHGETVQLCKNCHHELHRFTGYRYLRVANKQPKEFYYAKYALWLTSAVLVGFLFFLLG